MTSLDKQLEIESPYEEFEYVFGPEEYSDIPHYETRFDCRGVGVVVEDQVFIDEYNTYRGVEDLWDIEIESVLDVPWEERPEHMFVFRFKDDSSIKISEPNLVDANDDMVVYVARFLKVWGVDENRVLVWNVDDDRRVRVGLQELYHRVLNEHESYIHPRFR